MKNIRHLLEYFVKIQIVITALSTTYPELSLYVGDYLNIEGTDMDS